MVSIGLHLKEQEYKKTPLYIRVLHNKRKMKTNNSIFSMKDNYSKSYFDFKENIEDLKNQLEEEIEFLKSVVKQKTKRKSQIKNHIVESVIVISDDNESKNLTKEDYIEKVENYIKRLQKDFNLKIYSYDIHFDEGHIDEDGNKKINRHIHLIHSNVNMKTGKSFTKEIYKKSKRGISYIQDLISESFQMKRGELNSNKKHIKTSIYKQQQETINKQKKIIEEQEKEIEELKERLKKIEIKQNEHNNKINSLIEQLNTSKDIYTREIYLNSLINKIKIKINDNFNNPKDRKQIYKSNQFSNYKKTVREFRKQLKDFMKKDNFDINEVNKYIKLKNVDLKKYHNDLNNLQINLKLKNQKLTKEQIEILSL